MPWSYQVLLAGLVAVAAIYDLRFRRIPNWLTGAGIVIAILLNGFLFGAAGISTTLAGLGMAALIYIPLWLLRALGAGDVKLMMAVGAVVGPWVWLQIFMLSAVIGGAMAVILLLLRGRLGVTLLRSAQIVSSLASFRMPWVADSTLDVRHASAVTLPHGVTIAAGTLIYMVVLRLTAQA